MKRLYLLRHAKASGSYDLNDIDRSLSERGTHDARKLADTMQQKSYFPDRVLCSAAQRTRQTAAPLIQKLDIKDAAHEEALYNASAGTLFEHLKAQSEHDSILVVAHNPGIHQLVLFLMNAAQKQADDFVMLQLDYKPGTLTVMDCDIENWDDLSPQCNQVVDLITAKD